MLYGAACNVTLRHCALERCVLVALHGARVTLESSIMTSDVIGVYAAGRGTLVKATGSTSITGGLQVRTRFLTEWFAMRTSHPVVINI